MVLVVGAAADKIGLGEETTSSSSLSTGVSEFSCTFSLRGGLIFSSFNVVLSLVSIVGAADCCLLLKAFNARL
jgi:hypothetical protein